MSSATASAQEIVPEIEHRTSRRGEPAWDIALLYPLQGEWTEEEYLALDTNRLIELSDGCLEFLPMPTILHQLILQHLFRLLDEYLRPLNVGIALVAPLRVRLRKDKIREPDVVFLKPSRIKDVRKPPDGADLVMEVVSEDDPEGRERDLETKREEYALAGIAEYWIIEPREQRITVLSLAGKEYRVHGEFRRGSQATSLLLPGFSVDVGTALDAAQNLPGNK